ncbi:MAG: hypothetical protein HY926_15090 [Elusimicrobia bacterium]|nr:hypothetical protein [Elusimicrobiota bacterium]
MPGRKLDGAGLDRVLDADEDGRGGGAAGRVDRGAAQGGGGLLGRGRDVGQRRGLGRRLGVRGLGLGAVEGRGRRDAGSRLSEWGAAMRGAARGAAAARAWGKAGMSGSVPVFWTGAAKTAGPAAVGWENCVSAAGASVRERVLPRAARPETVEPRPAGPGLTGTATETRRESVAAAA